MTQAPDEHVYRLRSRTWATPAIAALELTPCAAPLSTFEPGQYVQLAHPAGLLPMRSYSIANAPRADGSLALLVSAVPDGPMSGWLSSGLAVGETVLVSGSYGNFVNPPGSRWPLLALAGGSGWAPVRALAEAAAQRGFTRAFTVLFSARTLRDVPDASTTARWQRAFPRFRFLYTLTRERSEGGWHGRIPQVLEQVSGPLVGTEIFISGPPPLVVACAEATRRLGATPGHVHTEEFYSDPNPW